MFCEFRWIGEGVEMFIRMCEPVRKTAQQFTVFFGRIESFNSKAVERRMVLVNKSDMF